VGHDLIELDVILPTPLSVFPTGKIGPIRSEIDLSDVGHIGEPEMQENKLRPTTDEFLISDKDACILDSTNQ
jgi:hypothetical protein